MKFIYELIFVTLWQVLTFSKEENHHGQGDSEAFNSIDIRSLNNSASKRRSLVRHRSSIIRTDKKLHNQNELMKSYSQMSREPLTTIVNPLSNKTRVTVRSVSNQNLNQTQSVDTNCQEQPIFVDDFRTFDSHIVVRRVMSSHCQNRSPPNPMHLREQLTDRICHSSYGSLRFDTHFGIHYHRCPPFFHPCARHHYSESKSPSFYTPSQQLKHDQELKQDLKADDLIDSQSRPVSPVIQLDSTKSSQDQQQSISGTLHNEIDELTPSEVSFPDHASSPSKLSEELTEKYSQLQLQAQVLVNESIELAQETYQRILRMSQDQGSTNSALLAVEQISENESKSIFRPDEVNGERSSDHNNLCHELCNKLNLADLNQITEIIDILTLHAPHVLKQQYLNSDPLINKSNITSENENNPCKQLLLHPPFKPKRLIHLCPDGSIQVLSTVDDNPTNANQQLYNRNNSNSAIISLMQRSRNLTSNDDNFVTDQRKSLYLNNDDSLVNLLEHSSQTQFKRDSSYEASQNDDRVVRVDLEANSEQMEIQNHDEEDSLPEIFLKRIIVDDNSPVTTAEISNITTLLLNE